MAKTFFVVLGLILSVVALADPTTQPTSQPASKPSKPQVLPVDVPTYLQDISVTIHAGNAQGSGTLVTRNGVNYVWTAGHVVADQRRTRLVIDGKGGTRTVVEFDDVQIVKELVEDGRSVGKISMDAEVIRYSSADTGEDLALLRVRKKNFVSVSAEFYLDIKIPSISTDLVHCGSLKGQFGSNSVTTGIVSQIGRVFDGNIYDQTTCTAFPGSSGGGVFLKDGRYVGMLTRGAGETFNLIVPVRRLRPWAERVGVAFAVDANLPIPSDEELKKQPVEDNGGSPQGKSYEGRSPGHASESKIKFWIAIPESE